MVGLDVSDQSPCPASGEPFDHRGCSLGSKSPARQSTPISQAISARQLRPVSLSLFELSQGRRPATCEDVELVVAQNRHHLAGVRQVKRCQPQSSGLQSGVMPGHPSMKERRTFLLWLSTLVSTNTTDCQTPKVGLPATTGMVRLGDTNAGNT